MASIPRASSASHGGLPPEVEPGGRPPDTISSGSSTRVGDPLASTSLQSTYQDTRSGSPDHSRVNSTVFNSGGSSSTRTVMQGSAWSRGIERAPQSSFAGPRGEGSPSQPSPTEVALSTRRERRDAVSRAATASPRIIDVGAQFSASDIADLLLKNRDVHDAYDALVASYRRKREAIDLDQDGLIVLESEDGRPGPVVVEEKLVSLEDRVAMIRDLEFSSRLIEYANHDHTRPMLKEGAYALFENVANNLSLVLQACFSELPWAGLAPYPTEDWYANFVTTLSRPAPTVGRLARSVTAERSSLAETDAQERREGRGRTDKRYN